MVDKSGGDAIQANQGEQLGIGTQDLNAVGAGGAGVVDGFGGAATAMGMPAKHFNRLKAKLMQR